jgi:hypothetical protein
MNKELEEYAEKTARAFDNDNHKALIQLVIEGAEWMQERMYSEEDMREALFHSLYAPKTDGYIEKTIDEIVRETISKFKNK